MSARWCIRALFAVLLCFSLIAVVCCFAEEPFAPALTAVAEPEVAAPADEAAPAEEATDEEAPAEGAETEAGEGEAAPAEGAGEGETGEAPQAAEEAPEAGEEEPPALGGPDVPASALTRRTSTELGIPLAVEWIKSMGPEPGNVTPPLVLGDRIFLTHGGTLYCLDAFTGGQKWSLSVKEANVSTAPLLWQNTIIVGVDNGLLMGLNPKDGSRVWKTDCGAYVAPNPQIVNDTLVVGSELTVLGLDPNSGRTRWGCSLSSGAIYGPLSDGTMLYFRCADGSVQSIDGSTGRYRWRVPAPTGPQSFPPLMVNGRVVLVEGRTLYAISRTGQTPWTAELPAAIGGPVTAIGGVLYVPCVDGQLYALRPTSGRIQRGPEYKVGGSVTAAPVVTDKYLFLGTSGALIYALDRASGAVAWVYRCRAPEQPVDQAASSGIYAPLTQAGGSLIALTGTGDLYSFSPDAPDAAGPTIEELKPEPGEALPNGTLVVSFEAFDDGCGLSPNAVTVTVDGELLDSRFDAPSGVGAAFLSKPEDGIHTVKVVAKDARGNTTTEEWSFLTDESLAPAEPTVPGLPGARTGREAPLAAPPR